MSKVMDTLERIQTGATRSVHALGEHELRCELLQTRIRLYLFERAVADTIAAFDDDAPETMVLRVMVRSANEVEA